MSVDASLLGGDDLRSRIAAIKNRIANPKPALQAGGKVLLQAAVDRIDAGGPGWTPNIEGTPLLRRSGALLASLEPDGSGDIFELNGNCVSVGTDLQANGYVLGALMQNGTGIFGPSGQRITPTTAQALAFRVGGTMVFASSIAGSPQRKFLFIDDKAADDVRAVFARYIMDGEA